MISLIIRCLRTAFESLRQSEHAEAWPTPGSALPIVASGERRIFAVSITKGYAF